MGIFSQKTKFKVAAPTIRKVVVPVEVAKPKPKFQFRDASSAPPTISRSSANRGDGPGGGSSSVRSSKTLSASPRTSTSPTSRASQSPYPASDSRLASHSRNGDRKRKLVSRAAHRASPASDRIEFGKDSDTDDDDWEATLNEREHRKRKRLNGSQHVDLDRQLLHPALRETLPRSKDGEAKEGSDKDAGDDGAKKVEGRDLKKLRIIHAKDVASVALKCVPVLSATEDEVLVELQYPGTRHRER